MPWWFIGHSKIAQQRRTFKMVECRTENKWINGQHPKQNFKMPCNYFLTTDQDWFDWLYKGWTTWKKINNWLKTFTPYFIFHWTDLRSWIHQTITLAFWTLWTSSSPHQCPPNHISRNRDQMGKTTEKPFLVCWSCCENILKHFYFLIRLTRDFINRGCNSLMPDWNANKLGEDNRICLCWKVDYILKS